MKKLLLLFSIIMFFNLLFCGVVEKLSNKNPIINSVTATPSQVSIQDTTILRVTAEDPDGDMLSFRWESGSSVGEFITNSGEEVQWVAPAVAGRFRIEVKAMDENGGKATGEVYVNVRGDESPIVTITQPVDGQIIPGIGFKAIEADVVFSWSLERVDFFLDKDSLLHSDFVQPYNYANWDISKLSGSYLITARAYELGNLSNFGEDSVQVFIEGVIPVPKK